MRNYDESNLLITGVGVTSAIGQGKSDFIGGLLGGQNAFRIMQRPGRQRGTSFIGAEIPSLTYPERLSKKLLRTASFTDQVAMITLHEAWDEARLDEMDGGRIGLVIGGSNLKQRVMLETHEKYADQIDFIRPTYGISFMDSDMCGLCSEQFGIKGSAYTVGGASASGHMAIIQAIQAVQTGQVDTCIALGALMDLSYLECQAFRILGAMGSDRYGEEPDKACRPFDEKRDGFIFGESCGAVVIERASTAEKRHVSAYAMLKGWAVAMDGNRNPNPSFEGEVQVIQKALKNAELSANQIDYINPHGTGSVIGDETELKAIRKCQLSHAYINGTKSITGHGLSAAGTVEVIATLLQMKEARLHPTRNLENPIDTSFNWVREGSVPHAAQYALNLSYGFGGINTAICLQRI